MLFSRFDHRCKLQGFQYEEYSTKGIPRTVNTVILNAEVPMTNETILDTWYDRITKWYLSKPWYIRLLGIGVVVAIVFLFLLRFIARGVPKEYEPDTMPTVPPANPTAPNDEEEVTNAEKLEGLKKQLIGQLKARSDRLATYAEQEDSLSKALTMEELNELCKKFKL
jgi:hypothetical protein